MYKVTFKFENSEDVTVFAAFGESLLEVARKTNVAIDAQMCIRDRCGLLIQYLCEKGKTPVLAVDADANSNLNEVLGVEVEMTLGEVREQIENAANSAKSPIPPSMSKADYRCV